MQRTASISAYDVMGDVFITARVRTHEHTGEERTVREFACQTTVQGTGEDEDREWLRDALVALLEDI